MKTKLPILYFIIFSTSVFGQNSFTNPIIPGGHPDPSICKVGDTFYIVNSTFEYFPGLPIHKSKDLINWELIGYGLHRESQATGAVNLVDIQSDGGIHAPTIRHNNGTFYIISTNVYYHEDTNTTDFVNFIITAKNAEGPWSEPYVLEGAPGIDPDIFFDDDGKVWYVGTHSPENPNFEGEGEIWLQEIDMENWELTGERHFLWRGACGGVWVEGPHIYKRNGYYYLLVAEGGTSYNHAVMIAVSDQITGPYISNERNPIFSTRHLSYDNWVHSTGHADLIEVEKNRWFMVALGIRGDEKRGSNMGRETHLIPVQWEQEPFEWKEVRYEWPVIAPETGKVERLNPVPFNGTTQKLNSDFTDHFTIPKLNLAWNFRRVPTKKFYSLTDNKGSLRLYTQPNIIKERGRASLMGFRQKESIFEYRVHMNFNPESNGSEAGINIFQKDDNFFSFTVLKENQKHFLQLHLANPNEEVKQLKKLELPYYEGTITLRVNSENHRYSFYYSLNGIEFTLFETTEAHHILSKKYTGAYMGVYATSNGVNSKDFADFDWVKFHGFPKL